MNKVILTGRLVRTPELKQTPNGTAVTRFTVAVNRPYNKDKEQKADFIDCIAWRGTAEFVAKYFTKGKPIELEGSIQTSSWQDAHTGEKRYRTEVNVSNVGFVPQSKDGGNGQSDARSAEPMGNIDGFPDIIGNYDDGDLPF